MIKIVLQRLCERSEAISDLFANEEEIATSVSNLLAMTLKFGEATS